MAQKSKSVYICSECGYETPRWLGQCPGCNEWNTLNEEIRTVTKEKQVAKSLVGSNRGRAYPLSDITADTGHRYNTGLKELNRLILAEVQDNPVQFLTTARIRLSCAEILNKEEQLNLFKLLKLKSESIIIDIKNILHNENLDFYKKMVMDNLLCEYNNLNSLLEGFERACKN